MSLLLVLGAGALVGFVATRSLRQNARHELHVVPQRLLPRPSRESLSSGSEYTSAATANLDAELRTIRGERPRSLYTAAQARAAKRAVAPLWGITMRVKE